MGVFAWQRKPGTVVDMVGRERALVFVQHRRHDDTALPAIFSS